MSFVSFVSKLLAIVLWLALASSASAADFTFAAFGDTPYSKDEEARFPGLIAEMNHENLAFVVNVGDFKNSIEACTDELFAVRRQWFDLSRHPFIYAPGDNEWTDCRRSVFDPRDPLERLGKLRELFAGGAESLGQNRIRLERQLPAYPEHASWEYQGLLFLTLNAPGPDNHARVPEEHAARDAAMREWVTRAFTLAQKRKSPAVVIFMQGDPWTAAGEPRRGFARLLETMASQTRAFRGEVMLVHGDTHRYRVDQPLRETVGGVALANFTRVEVFGYPTMNWVRVRVSEEAGRLRFTVTPGS